MLVSAAQILAQTRGMLLVIDSLRLWGWYAVALVGLAFAVHYTGHSNWLRRPVWVAAAILLLSMALVLLGGPFDALGRVNSRVVETDGFADVTYDYGPVLLIHIILMVLVVEFSLLLLLYHWLHIGRRHHASAALVFIGYTIPWWFGEGLFVAIFNLPEWWVMPLGVSSGVLLMALGLQRVPFQALVPIAREAMIEHMRDPVVVLDHKGLVLDHNPAAAHLVPAAARNGSLVGQSITSYMPNWPLMTGDVDPSETVRRALPADRGGTLYEIRVSPLGDFLIDGETRAVSLYVLQDLTRRAEAERERESLIADLDAFAHMVAHDLKNPLAGVVGHAAILEMDLPSLPLEEIQVAVHAISRDAFRMKTIIDELLLLASVRDQDSVSLGPVDMTYVITSALGRLSYMISDFKPDIHLPEAEWPLAVGYAPWLEEVWTNYLSNAMKYGGSPPRIELGSDPVRGGCVRFWVQDNGAGLTAEEQARLFAPFTRLQQARAEGHGLGLSIVRRIVERLHGRVGVESTPGEGSRFWFELPHFNHTSSTSPATGCDFAADTPA